MNIKHIFRLSERLSDYPLRQELVNRLGTRFVNEDAHYSATIEDLEIMFKCVNELVFNSKLPHNTTFEIRDRTNEMAKGVIMFKPLDDHYVPHILYIREDQRDTMVTVINALCHKMIHEYDILYGPIRHLKDKTVTVKNNLQFIGNYDVHGSYFQSYMRAIERLGIPVSISQPDKIAMRYFKHEDTINDSEPTEQNALVTAAKQFYDAIKTDELFLVEVKNDEIYVVMQ